jgi:hypothetical protein
MADPFFISCVIQSNCPRRDLTTSEGVIEAVNHEVAHRRSEMSGTWSEYINKTVNRINDQYGKRVLLHLSKHNERYWTPRQLKKALHLEEDEKTIHRKLISMVKGDLIEWGSADIDFRGLQDGTLNLILRHRFEKEIAQQQTSSDLRPGFREQIAELQRKNRSLQGKLNHAVGQMAEYQFANTIRSRKRFRLGDFFNGVLNTTVLNMVNVRTRVIIQRDDGKSMEIDIAAESSDGQVLLVEIRKRKIKVTAKDAADFHEKTVVYQSLHPEQSVLAGFISLGGFTAEAQLACEQFGIGWTNTLLYF